MHPSYCPKLAPFDFWMEETVTNDFNALNLEAYLPAGMLLEMFSQNNKWRITRAKYKELQQIFKELLQLVVLESCYN